MAYEKVFSRVSWQNEPSVATPINETNLNKGDYALDIIDTRVVSVDSRLTNLEDYEPTVLAYAQRAETAAETSEGYAVGKHDGTDVPSTDPAYHNNAKYYSDGASDSAEDAEAYAVGKRGGTDVTSGDVAYHNNSKYYAEQASDSATGAQAAYTNTQTLNGIAKSWAVGPGGSESTSGTDTNNSYWWYTQTLAIAQGIQGGLHPMGTITFSQLPTSNILAGDMYNISNEFTTDNRFKEGAGVVVPAGAEVYWTSDEYWSVLAGSPVAGVKGNAEQNYRTGNVNITPTNIGLGNVGNFKAVSTESSQGLTSTEKENARNNIGAGTSSFSGSYSDLSNKPTLGTAAALDSTTSITSGGTGLPTAGTVYTALDGKMDAITGTQGQMIGFDSSGNPEAQNMPSTGHTIKNNSGTSFAQRGNLQFTTGFTVTDDSSNNATKVAGFSGSYNDLTDKPTSLGHTIEDSSTSYTQRTNLKFTGNVTVTDDSTNNATVVNVTGGGTGAVSGVKGNAESDYRTGNVNITPANIGLGNVGNFKAVSTEASQGLTTTEQSNARANIGAGTSSFSGSYTDLTNKPTSLGHTIKDSTTTYTQRDNLKFVGATISDDSTNNATVVTITSSGVSVTACYEETTALYAHAIDDIIYMSSHFYKVTAAIAVGDTISVSTNISANTGISAGMAVYVSNMPS